MGVHVSRCNCPIVQDLQKIFDVYWAVYNASIPDKWPVRMNTHYNLTDPLVIELEKNETAGVSFSVSSRTQYSTCLQHCITS